MPQVQKQLFNYSGPAINGNGSIDQQLPFIHSGIDYPKASVAVFFMPAFSDLCYARKAFPKRTYCRAKK
jgi:hypothetical protein